MVPKVLKCRKTRLSCNLENNIFQKTHFYFQVTNQTIDMLNYGNGMKKKFSVNVIGYTVLPPPLIIQRYAVADVALKEEIIEIEGITQHIHVAVKEEYNEIEDKSFVEDIEKERDDEAEQSPNKEDLVTDTNHDVNESCSDTCNRKTAETQLEKYTAAKYWQGDDKKLLHGKKITEYTQPQPQLKIKPFYACSICTDIFTNKRKFLEHLRIHTPKKTPRKDLYCDICMKTFIKKRTFYVHMRTHARGREFDCDTCHKSFKTKVNLDRHMKMHMEKSHMFAICVVKDSDKRFI